MSVSQRLPRRWRYHGSSEQWRAAVYRADGGNRRGARAQIHPDRLCRQARAGALAGAWRRPRLVGRQPQRLLYGPARTGRDPGDAQVLPARRTDREPGMKARAFCLALAFPLLPGPVDAQSRISREQADTAALSLVRGGSIGTAALERDLDTNRGVWSVALSLPGAPNRDSLAVA